MGDHVSVSREIEAPPERVWDLVSDLPRMGEWSNENTGGTWLDDKAGPVVGAQFRGRNRNGVRRWSTRVTVVEAVPGSRFAFEVDLPGIPISRWSYDLQPSDRGCLVTEAWIDRRPGWFKPVARLATGVADRAVHTRSGIELTLEQIASVAESTS